MNLIQKILLFCSLITISFISCKKTAIFDEQGNLLANSEFSTTNIRAWYNQTFLNSTEGKLSSSEKKYPLWKNGIYYRWLNYEVFEFPLKKNKIQIDVPSKLSTGDKKKLTAGSLTRIRFIKDKDGNISVVEVNYIPDYEYLKKYNYDISNTAFGKENSDFTGRMILKKWNGSIISKFVLADGKVNGKISLINKKNFAKNSNTSSIDGECQPGQTEWCIFIALCDVYPDGLITNCTDGELVEGSCWCEGTPTDPCGGMSQQQCDCEQLGVCGSGGGGVPEIPEVPEVPEVATFEFENVYAVKVSGSTGTNENWKMYYKATLTGNKFNDVTQNVYTSFSGNPGDESSHFYHNYNAAQGGLYGYILSSVYCHWLSGSYGTRTSEFIEENKKFKSIYTSAVNYPNYVDQNGQPAPFTVLYSNTKFAIASTDL